MKNEDLVTSYEYNGIKINVFVDGNAENPRNANNITIMAAFHRRYNLGDDGTGYAIADYESFDSMRKAIIKNEDVAVILPLFLYDHTGLRIKVGSFKGLLPQGHAEFDSGQVGFIWMTKKAARQNWDWDIITKSREKTIVKYIESEVECYDNYLSGSVYGVIIEDINGESIDSSWGYSGYDSIQEYGYAITDAKRTIDEHLKKVQKDSLPENQIGQTIFKQFLNDLESAGYEIVKKSNCK